MTLNRVTANYRVSLTVHGGSEVEQRHVLLVHVGHEGAGVGAPAVPRPHQLLPVRRVVHDVRQICARAGGKDRWLHECFKVSR